MAARLALDMGCTRATKEATPSVLTALTAARNCLKALAAHLNCCLIPANRTDYIHGQSRMPGTIAYRSNVDTGSITRPSNRCVAVCSARHSKAHSAKPPLGTLHWLSMH